MDRTETACTNCRARKIRCDRTLSACAFCKKKNLDCFTITVPRLLWLPVRTTDEGEDVEVHTRRQLIFRGEDQARHADLLLSCTAQRSIHSILEEIDHAAETILDDEIISTGPFYVFKHTPTNHSELELEDTNQQNDLSLSIPLLPPSDLSDFTMTIVHPLLHHYQTTLVSFFTPAQVPAKSPWKKLYIPSVLTTMGEIISGGDSSNAKVAVLFAVLAISAFSLATTENKQWYTLGELYRNRATRRLKVSLRYLSMKPKMDKYKDILMALLSMVTICVVSGQMTNAVYYLRDINQIIQYHGKLKVVNSPKVQMLHSIYLYLIILTQAMTIHDRNMIGTGDLVHTSPILVSRTTFEEIYSIPETLFQLIQRTTQLANERYGLIGLNDELVLKITSLENEICTWDHHPPSDILNNPPIATFPHHLLRAMHSALIIYFYRFVKPTHTIILQPHVQKTIFHLLEYDKQKARSNDHSANTCWPGFIAGCEAAAPQSRRDILDWLTRSAEETGIRMFTVALNAVQRVWRVRDAQGREDLCWGRVLREFGGERVLVLS